MAAPVETAVPLRETRKSHPESKKTHIRSPSKNTTTSNHLILAPTGLPIPARGNAPGMLPIKYPSPEGAPKNAAFLTRLPSHAAGHARSPSNEL